jgi:hypothetical protein
MRQGIPGHRRIDQADSIGGIELARGPALMTLHWAISSIASYAFLAAHWLPQKGHGVNEMTPHVETAGTINY